MKKIVPQEQVEVFRSENAESIEAESKYIDLELFHRKQMIITQRKMDENNSYAGPSNIVHLTF
ncbi:MAG: hypothetical protein P8J32_07480 [bacterium]|nr:hypothetical protein [bacterium]